MRERELTAIKVAHDDPQSASVHKGGVVGDKVLVRARLHHHELVLCVQVCAGVCKCATSLAPCHHEYIHTPKHTLMSSMSTRALSRSMSFTATVRPSGLQSAVNTLQEDPSPAGDMKWVSTNRGRKEGERGEEWEKGEVAWARRRSDADK